MNRLSRIASAFLLVATAMLMFTSSAFAAYPSNIASTTRQTTYSPKSSKSSPSAQTQTVMRYRNGTTVTYSNGMRFIQPHGRHAQPMIQRRDEKGRWMKAVPAKTWAPPAAASK